METPHPEIASHDAWVNRRRALLQKEKELTRAYDQLNAERRRMPMEKVEKDYRFSTPKGEATLLELFEGRGQLIVYHFMFAPEWEVGCPSCTAWVDSIEPGVVPLMNDRQTTFTLISRADLAKLTKYRNIRGWTFDWASSSGSDFNCDFHATLDPSRPPVEYNYAPRTGEEVGEGPGLSVFFRLGDDVYHSYSCYARGIESLSDGYRLLDVTPYGRQESFEDSPAGWPQLTSYGYMNPD